MILWLLACKGVDSPEEAALAYTSLDGAVSRGLALGLQGFNAASSANIDDQEDAGDTSGTMVISGQVDQGSSDNKGLRLQMALTDYSDTLGDDGEPDVLYDTDDPAALELQLRNIPDGTLSVTLIGDFVMRGVLEGVVSLDLTLDGTIEDDGSAGTQRVEGGTHVSGTATSDYGVYEVDLDR